ncbi:MAG: phosphotyrosine protein phosphatase [Bacteroidota bacterium]
MAPCAAPLRVLFVCSRNRLRSPTAEAVVAGWPDIEAVSAGTAPDAEARVSADLVAWADVIVAFEARHRRHLQRAFGPLLRDTRLVVLGVPDDHAFMDPELVDRLRARLPDLLGTEPPR